MRADQMPTKANLKEHDDDEKCPSISSELITMLKRKNEALLAQVEKMPCKCRPHDYTSGEPYTCDRCRILSGSQQSLDPLKAGIEEETIERCSKAVETLLRPIDSSAAMPDHAGMLENLMANTAIDVLTDMPRKYRPSNDTKAANGGSNE